MALLLSADPETAEATLATTLEDIDIAVPPKTDDLGILQKTIIIKIVRDADSVSPENVSNAGSMVQRGLRPVLQLEKFPRVCFVLRFLLGYGMSSCAQIMGIEEAGVKALLHLGLIQFHRAIMGGTPERLKHLPLECSGRSVGRSGINYVGFGESNRNAGCSVSPGQCATEIQTPTSAHGAMQMVGRNSGQVIRGSKEGLSVSSEEIRLHRRWRRVTT